MGEYVRHKGPKVKMLFLVFSGTQADSDEAADRSQAKLAAYPQSQGIAGHEPAIYVAHHQNQSDQAQCLSRGPENSNFIQPSGEKPLH